MKEQNILQRLVGLWTGVGKAMYPTIQRFDYTETLTAVLDESRPLLHYEQRTYKKAEGSEEYVTSHWESGFVRVLADSSLEWICTQSGGRVEVMDGVVTQQGQTVIIELSSRLIANDPRLVRSTRYLKLHDDILEYAMAMSTIEIAEMTMHLEGKLHRASSLAPRAR